jgi:hypothetical protein
MTSVYAQQVTSNEPFNTTSIRDHLISAVETLDHINAHLESVPRRETSAHLVTVSANLLSLIEPTAISFASHLSQFLKENVAHLRSIIADVESGSVSYLGSQLFIVIVNLVGLHRILETRAAPTRSNHVLMIGTPTLVHPSKGRAGGSPCRVITRVLNLEKLRPEAKW